jgi:muramidase (phage lysozyme)
VESSGIDSAVGDGGKAIGPYQIHRAYWQDAVDHDPSIGGTYQNCFDPEYAEKVVRGYLDRYAPANATMEQLARIHNGGGGILKKKNSTKAKDKKAWNNTTKYWEKIKKELDG